MLPQEIVFKTRDDEYVWFVELESESFGWLTGAELEFATDCEPQHSGLLPMARLFLEYVVSHEDDLKRMLLDFHNGTIETLREQSESWCFDLPDASSADTLWRTMTDFKVVCIGRFHGGPKMLLLAECDWLPDGGIEFSSSVSSDGAIDYVGFPQ